MRYLIFVFCAALAAGAVHGDVRITVKGDGSKVITNSGGRTAKGSDLTWLAAKHDRRSRYDEIIERHAERYRIDATLVRAVIQVESDFNPSVVSSKGACGLMQLMPATASRFGVREIHDPEQNIHGGVQYLAHLMRLFNGDLTRVLAGYNAGENAVIRHGGVPPYAETTEYVRRAMTVYYGRPWGGGALWLPGRKDGPRLGGGFDGGAAQPAALLIPGATWIGSH